MQKKYEEQLKICIFLARVEFFTVIANQDDEFENALDDKVWKLITKNKLDEGSTGGLFWGLYGVKWYQQYFSRIAVKLGFLKMCPIFRFSGFYTSDNANPRRAYQKWCAVFDGVFKEQEKEN